MKFAPLTLAALSLFFTAPAIYAVADDDQASPAMEHQGHDHGDWDEGKMKARLGLTDDQVAKLKDLRTTSKEAFKAIMEKDKGLIARLNDQVVNKASDSDIQTTLNDLKANRNAMRDQMEKMQDQKDAILTPTQQAKLLLAHRRMMKRGMHGGMHDGMHKNPASDTDNGSALSH